MDTSKQHQGLVIAGTHSSAGKSSVAMGLMHLLKSKGWSIKPFKVGPDYIDPGHHQRACDQPSYNLDTVMSTKKYVRDLFDDIMAHNDIAIVEGVMGLYDGISPKSEKGSTAEIAKLLNLPVILVIDGRSMARSTAALVSGFIDMDPELNLIGVIANNINSTRHAGIIKTAIEHHTSAKLLGCLPTSAKLNIPSRHLGLHQSCEQSSDKYKNWGKHIESHIDLKKLLKLFKLKKISSRSTSQPIASPRRWLPKKVSNSFKIAIARDEAFQFIYQDTLDCLAHQGFDISFFSPLHDKHLPANIDCYYFPGGYPELHANKLSKNHSLLKEIKSAGKEGKPVIGECGGLMYLGKSLIDSTGKRFPMTGLFNYSTSFKKRSLNLGYRKLKNNLTLTGHEFHYSSLVENKERFGWTYLPNSKGKPTGDGFKKFNCFAFYCHIYWGSNPQWMKFLINLIKN